MCFTNDDFLHEEIQSLRHHGQGKHRYDNVRIGVNGRMATLQAAVLLTKFQLFKEEIALRQMIARRYSEALSDVASPVAPPRIPEGFSSVWAQYTVLAKDEGQRSILQEKLRAAGIPTAIYYPKPLHFQKAFSFLGYKEDDFPVSEAYSRRVFSLPMHPYLVAEDQQRILDAITG
jgi:dTDP-4-amino-4,6-dideoxygalactose transaminase